MRLLPRHRLGSRTGQLAVGVLALMVILIAGVPIGVALGITGFLGLWWLLGLEPALIKSGVLVFPALLGGTMMLRPMTVDRKAPPGSRSSMVRS